LFIQQALNTSNVKVQPYFGTSYYGATANLNTSNVKVQLALRPGR